MGRTTRTLPEPGVMGHAERLFKKGCGVCETPWAWKARDGPHVGADMPLERLVEFSGGFPGTLIALDFIQELPEDAIDCTKAALGKLKKGSTPAILFFHDAMIAAKIAQEVTGDIEVGYYPPILAELFMTKDGFTGLTSRKIRHYAVKFSPDKINRIKQFAELGAQQNPKIKIWTYFEEEVAFRDWKMIDGLWKCGIGTICVRADML